VEKSVAVILVELEEAAVGVSVVPVVVDGAVDAEGSLLVVERGVVGAAVAGGAAKAVGDLLVAEGAVFEPVPVAVTVTVVVAAVREAVVTVSGVQGDCGAHFVVVVLVAWASLEKEAGSEPESDSATKSVAVVVTEAMTGFLPVAWLGLVSVAAVEPVAVSVVVAVVVAVTVVVGLARL
jgi:predicted small integral membrane protein